MIKSGILLLQTHKFVGVLGQRTPAQIGPWITAAPPLPPQAPPPRHKDNTLDNSVEITRHQFPGWYDSSYVEHASLTSSILSGLQISPFFGVSSHLFCGVVVEEEWPWMVKGPNPIMYIYAEAGIPWENMNFQTIGLAR